MPAPPRRADAAADQQLSVAHEPAITESQRPGRSGRRFRRLVNELGCRVVDRPGVAGLGRDRATFDLLEGPAPQSLRQLLAVQAVRPHELVRRLPVPVADELPPAADGPVLSPRRLPAGDDGRRALPEDAVGRRPADALPVDLAVGQEQPAAVDRDVVVEDPRRPALDRPAEAVRRGRLALQEHVRPGRQGADREVVPAVVRPAALEQGHLAAGVVRVPTIAADLRDRPRRRAVLHGHPLAAFPDADGRSGEMRGGHLAHPGVLRRVEADRHPGMLLVVGVVAVELGFAAEVLHAHLADPARPCIRDDRRRTEGRIEGRGQGCVQRDRGAVDGGDDAVEAEVHLPRLPVQVGTFLAGGEAVHAEGRDPGGGAGTPDEDRVAHAQPADVGDPDAFGPDGDVIVGDPQRRRGDDPPVLLALDRDQGAPVGPLGHQHRPARTVSLAAKDDTSRRDAEAAADLVATGQEQHRPADAACVGRLSRDEVDGRLDSRPVVPLGRGDHDPDGGVGDGDTASHIAASGEVGDAIPAAIGRVGQATGLIEFDVIAWLLPGPRSLPTRDQEDEQRQTEPRPPRPESASLPHPRSLRSKDGMRSDCSPFSCNRRRPWGRCRSGTPRWTYSRRRRRRSWYPTRPSGRGRDAPPNRPACRRRRCRRGPGPIRTRASRPHRPGNR